jgi:hypothetical protein
MNSGLLPSKRRHDAISGSHPTLQPAASKRQRAEPAAISPVLFRHPSFNFPSDTMPIESSAPFGSEPRLSQPLAASQPLVPPVVKSSPRAIPQPFVLTKPFEQDPEIEMENQTHEYRLEKEKERSGKTTTQGNYDRHVKNYEAWFTKHWPNIPPHPITPAKVALFLKEESQRQKVSPFSSGIYHILTYSLTRYTSNEAGRILKEVEWELSTLNRS